MKQDCLSLDSSSPLHVCLYLFKDLTHVFVLHGAKKKKKQVYQRSSETGLILWRTWRTRYNVFHILTSFCLWSCYFHSKGWRMALKDLLVMRDVFVFLCTAIWKPVDIVLKSPGRGRRLFLRWGHIKIFSLPSTVWERPHVRHFRGVQTALLRLPGIVIRWLDGILMIRRKVHVRYLEHRETQQSA